tara:strand:- start:918 stop:1514 length:597 start_codon:yes stop_codon:yes gene_type:complete
MTKQYVNIVEIATLYEILSEVKSMFLFKISNFPNTQVFINSINNNDLNASNSIIISNKNNNHLLLSKTIDPKNLILVENMPIKIDLLLDKINTSLIKKKYNFQAQVNIKDYTINLNSKIISNQSRSSKLTEREIDIILFLKDREHPQSVNNLQNEVWNYSSDLETHTVETHIYRLRKKFKDHFNDDSFILSLKEGYKI